MRIWIPVFIWKDEKGIHYDVHGVEEQMVSNRKNRTEIEFDMVSCFFSDSDVRPGKENGRLFWMQVKLTHADTYLPIPVETKIHRTRKLMPEATN